MKWFACGIAWLLAWIGYAVPPKSLHLHTNNVFVLIQPSLVGSSVDLSGYWQPAWVLWPPALDISKGGRLLSVSSGANWAGENSFFGPNAYAELKHHRYFDVKSTVLQGIRTDLLLNTNDAATSNSLLLARNSNQPLPMPFRLDDKWPIGSVMVTEASSWDEVRALETSTSGRVLAVEYPARADVPWTRYWLRGHGWPEGHPTRRFDLGSNSQVPLDQGVPGLVRAQKLLPLLFDPDTFSWQQVDARDWPGANRFLELNHRVGPWVAGIWISFVASASIWGTVLVINERTSRILPTVLNLILLSPGIANLTGLFCRQLGSSSWMIWALVSPLIVLSASTILSLWQRKALPKVHPLAPTFLLGLVLLCLIDPLWSFMSPVFGGRTWLVSPLGVSAILGYLTGLVGSIQGCGSRLTWLARGLCVFVLIAGLTGISWWSPDRDIVIVLPLVALLIGERRYRWSLLLVMILWLKSLWLVSSHGLVWSPGGLLLDGRDLEGFNAYPYVEFLMSSSLYVLLPTAVGISLFGYRFFFHQMKSLRQLDQRRSALTMAACASFALGILNPCFLYGGLSLAAGAMSALLFDAVQTM